jgi:hypothetical protein
MNAGRRCTPSSDRPRRTWRRRRPASTSGSSGASGAYRAPRARPAGVRGAHRIPSSRKPELAIRALAQTQLTRAVELDGLHVSFNLVFDRLLMLEQLGLVPAPAAAR